MAVTKQKKEEILAELIEKFTRSQSVVFADYRGLDVASISDLRNKLREGDAEMKVAKKTLIGLAAKDQKIENIDDTGMEGPIAATFSYEDPLAGIKVLFNFSKQNDNLKLLGGVIDGKAVGPDVIERYAKIPGREELLAKFIGSMNSPVSGFVGTLNNVLSGFVRVVSAYKDSLPQEEAPARAEAHSGGKATEEPTPVAETETDSEEVASEEDKPAEINEVEPKAEEKKEDEPVEDAEPAEAPEEEKKDEGTPVEDAEPEAT